MSEEDLATLQEVSAWLTEPLAEMAQQSAQEYWWDFFVLCWTNVAGPTYFLKAEGIDPFIGALQGFFQRIYEFVVHRWSELWGWIHDVSRYIESFWNTLSSTLWDVYRWLEGQIEGLINLIWNGFVLIWSELIASVETLTGSIVAPIKEIWQQITSTLAEWFEKIRAQIALFLQDPAQWLLDLGREVWQSIQGLGAELWDIMVTTGNAVASWIGEKIVAVPSMVSEYLRDVLFWLWEQIKVAFVFVKDEIVPAVWEATTGAAGWLKDQFTHTVGLAYDELMDHAKSFTPITPAKSVQLAGIMFGSAVGFGALAHAMALGVEAIPNLKYMGVHYMSSFAAHMGGFGAISSATMGVIAALALRVPFSYYMNNLLRPTIPDDKLLIEFRAKRELDFSQFKRYMGYHGHSDQWVAKIDSWLWKDPRLFEILYCADVTVPPREWLVRKFERAGYEDIDVDILCRVVERRTTRSPRTYYASAMRRNFRHGFLSESEVEWGVRDLEMAPEGTHWIKRAGELDVIYETFSDLVTAYRTAYRNDIITEGQCLASLAALGLPRVRAEAIVYLEWVRKYPRATKAERAEVEEPWAELQAEYSRAYIESFRRGLITQGELVTCLVAIGIERKVAEVTAFFEALKLVPKPKPEEIPVPTLPLPPEPPTYES